MLLRNHILQKALPLSKVVRRLLHQCLNICQGQPTWTLAQEEKQSLLSLPPFGHLAVKNELDIEIESFVGLIRLLFLLFRFKCPSHLVEILHGP